MSVCLRFGVPCERPDRCVLCAMPDAEQRVATVLYDAALQDPIAFIMTYLRHEFPYVEFNMEAVDCAYRDLPRADAPGEPLQGDVFGKWLVNPLLCGFAAWCGVDILLIRR